MNKKLLPTIIHKNVLIDTGKIPDIVWRPLVVPAHRSVVRIECKHRICVEIRAWAHTAIEIRTRITGSPKEEIKLSIICPRNPGAAAASGPGLAIPGPAFRAGLARFRDVVPPPHQSATIHIEGINVASDTIFRSRIADDHEILHNQGRHRGAFPGAAIRK